MSIIYNAQKKIFSLHTQNTTYQMQVDALGYLIHLYYGKKEMGDMDYLLTYYDRGFSGNPYAAGDNRKYSLDVLPQEYPTYGTGDYRTAALIVQNQDGTYGCDLRYKEHQIIEGKYSIEGLPAVYASKDEAATLEIVLEDKVKNIEVTLRYGVLANENIITRNVKIVNKGQSPIGVQKAAAACLDFIGGKFELIDFYGRHAMERNMQRMSLSHGVHKISSKRGTSSHQYNPMMILSDAETTENHGNCYSMSFVYSGCFEGTVEYDQFNQTRMMFGLQEEVFSYPLAQGAALEVPEVILTYSDQGFNKLSQQLHSCIRNHICRGRYKTEISPILVNSWEANYFDFTGDSLVELARQAAEVNIDMLVLDDGWFGKRDDDNSGLGDWFVNEDKIGCSLGELISRVNALGVKFGIWMEPEMISMDSDLYRAHPDWAFTIPGKDPIRSRNQLVLDFARAEVVDYIYEQICSILDQGNIEYLKWDMNRSLADVYSKYSSDQGRVMYDYMLGVYDLLERITMRYPNLLIEGCSGGGGRFDAGMLYYTPQIWCSDNTDAIDRVRIQYGTSFGYPVSSMGAHVSAVPNHQTGRMTSLNTRGIVAMAGTFGYELDLGKLSDEEKEEIRAQISVFRKHAALLQYGTYYRLTNPFEEAVGAWEMVSEDKNAAILNVVMLEIHGNMTVSYVKMAGLEATAFYKEQQTGKCYSGSSLMQGGLPIPVENSEYCAYQYYFEKVSECG